MIFRSTEFITVSNILFPKFGEVLSKSRVSQYLKAKDTGTFILVIGKDDHLKIVEEYEEKIRILEFEINLGRFKNSFLDSEFLDFQ